MPEGDSVLQLSERLQWMTGRTVTHTDIRVPRWATTSLTGQTVHRVWPYGKHLFMHIGDTLVHTHLKMEGVWSIHAQGTRWRRPHHTARIILRFTPQHEGGPQIEIVGHSLGFVRLHPAEAYPEVIAHLGPDILAEPHTWESTGKECALANIMTRPGRSLGAALVDQTMVAGIGNEYRAEVMFLLGWHPAIPVDAVGESGVTRALEVARRVMWDNRLEPHRVFTGDRRRGMSTYVFGRADRPCRRCGTLIETSTLGGRWAGGDSELDSAELERIIWWCPHCQALERSATSGR
ncbi:Fpg/Nei family DNA glycosylase [Corynebacterium sp. 320]|uniref:DNA-formamidopyrimidine glycosylase family protein n=1 Tax=Corynebacterium TaxID=1716 RepID=UPI00125CCCE4|nr:MULTISPECIES: DNA-formamidopyrimidine glycosylase family protein [Corynebacterium]KAB1501399.1 Fpg/Nei family DNA glycosylase [Corynebacterium sp. 320]KAB1551476.1 Fpg/Nei family DNA glycosylase [Corynebacterium sp. 321]KAB3525757.1 Fpg/Nei family DNA glycosylase [Corynebacterium sp. 250]QNP92644.1 Fpg/Nei family DNA glycosylase [Corynebacterium zhongnanshanii]